MALRSIKAKILWSILPIVMTLSIASTAIAVYQQTRSMDRNLKRIGINAVKNLANNSELGLYAQNPAFLRPALQALSGDRSFAYAIVYNHKNEVLGAELSKGVPSAELKKIPEPVLKAVLHGTDPIGRNLSLNGRSIYEFILPVVISDKNSSKNNDVSMFLDEATLPVTSVKESGRRIGYVRYGEGLEDYHATVVQTMLENLVILFLSLSAAFLFILVLASRITKPVEELAAISGAVSDGDLEQRINAVSNDEVGKLAISFNRMIAAIKQRDEELRAAHSELEMRVAERTCELTLLNQSLNVEIAERIRIEQNLENTASILARKADDLEKSNKELDQFAYIAAHDLKAPLRAIANLANWIEEDLEGQLSEGTAKHMQMLQGRVQRLENLIEGILSYSKLGNQEKHYFEKVDTGEVTKTIVEMLSPRTGFTIAVTSPMPVFQGVRLFFDQVLSNLLSNALKYHDRDTGRIEISARDLGDYYEFSVADDGPGIDKKYHEKIFVIFQTLNARDDVESTGIGLAIVKKIIEEQGGTIAVSSEVGKGATFIFTWPKVALSDCFCHLSKYVRQ